MGRTACTEPQYLYKSALYLTLLPDWAASHPTGLQLNIYHQKNPRDHFFNTLAKNRLFYEEEWTYESLKNLENSVGKEARQTGDSAAATGRNMDLLLSSTTRQFIGPTTESVQ